MSWIRKLREAAGTAEQAPGQAHKSFTARLRAAAEHASDEEHPWMDMLRKLKGHVVGDVERISTRDVFDRLEVPPKKRPQLTRQLSRMMSELGWSNIRAHGLNGHSFLSRVRGFARPAPGSKALM